MQTRDRWREETYHVIQHFDLANPQSLHDVFGENDPARRRAVIDEIFTEDGVFYDPSRGVYRGRDEIDRIAGAFRVLILTFDISQSRNQRNWAMAGGSSGCRAAPVSRQLTPGLISSLLGTAGLPPLISFSTSYPELRNLLGRYTKTRLMVALRSRP